MVKYICELRLGVEGCPKQGLADLVGRSGSTSDWGPLGRTDIREISFGKYQGCQIKLYIPMLPYIRTQQVHVSGELENVEAVVKTLGERYGWAKPENWAR